jgi:hypothetical protein
MAKPRVFISSTYYDLKYIRKSVEQFVESLGYEAIVFESGDVPFSHDLPLDEACYREIGLCHVLVLIIGGRYGSGSSEGSRPKSEYEIDKQYELYNSVTKREYETARQQDLPIYIFVEKGVLAEYETYRKNRNGKVRYAHVDSVNIFRLLDDIFAQSRNNLVREFSNADDITSWLRDQWSGLLAHFISQRRDEASVGQIKAQIESLSSVVGALKAYSEQIVRSVAKDDSERIINQVDKELASKQQEIALRSVPFFDHLISNHSVTAENIARALISATSTETLVDKLRSLDTDDCPAFEQADLFNSYEVSQINSLRKTLGLESFAEGRKLK